METNDIRDYNEITNNGIKPSIKYIERTIQIRTDEDKDACIRFLTINNNLELCQKYYDTAHINSIIEYSDYFLYYSTQENTTDVVAFALVKSKSKKKGKILDILLVCAIPNKNKFGKMIAHSIHNFAVKYKYEFLYVSPRTSELRKTFVKYGFESVHGREGIDEVLEKEIDLNIPTIYTRGATRKHIRPSNQSFNIARQITI